MTRDKAKRAGRQARLALRARGPAENPCPPGQIGGAYAPLAESEIGAIYAAALDLLEQLGMGDVPERLATRLLAAGAVPGDGGRILFPRSLCEDVIAGACKRFVFHGRDPDRSIEVGGSTVHFGTGGAAVQVLDLDTGLYRAATLADLHDFARLQDRLTNISWFTRNCIATDVADPFDLDVNTAYALLANTTKPVATAFTLASHVAPIVAMFDIAAGGEGAFARRPFVKAHVSPVISPMRYGADAVAVIFECIRHNIPLTCITAAQAGATAPAPLAGFLAQSLAETLASLVMVHAIRPGHPMVFSNWPFVVDLRTGSFAGGGSETALMNAASAQIINWLGLPSGVAASMTDAKAIDAQYGMEKGMTSLAAALAGANMVYESSGMTASLLGASFEAFVLDDEMHSANYRILRGIEVGPDTLDTDAIIEAVLGTGHFLSADQTMAAMERDFFYPALADRTSPDAWAAAGARTAWERATDRARELLQSDHPRYLSAAEENAIRERFRILSG
ncbi:MAG TPA: trimethylamine methyltransferase [Rhodobacteraceae bacterium]|nr:trimethylamine methyltransferase [Paracoccaceae bacterium]